MISAVRHNLKNLANFKGRDGRSVFWRYFFFVLLLNIFVMFAVSFPTFLAVFSEISALASSGDSAALEGAALDSMVKMGLPETLVRTGIYLGALNIVLIAAALVRRAHDSGLPGLVLTMPLGLQLVWMYFAYQQLDGLGQTFEAAVEATQAGTEPDVQAGMIAQDLIGWLAILVVVAIGIIKSQNTANQYGEPPVKG